MNAHDRDDRIRALFEARCLPLLQAKGHDYSGDEDALANFRRHGLRGIVVRLGDKYERLNSLVWKSRDAKVAGEKVEDTLVDLINYALLALVVKEDEAGQTSCPGCHGRGYYWTGKRIKRGGREVEVPDEQVPCEVCKISPFARLGKEKQ